MRAGCVVRTLGSGLVGKGLEPRQEPRTGMCQERIYEVFNLKLPFELGSSGHCGQEVHLDATGTMHCVEGRVSPLLKPQDYTSEETSV